MFPAPGVYDADVMAGVVMLAPTSSVELSVVAPVTVTAEALMVTVEAFMVSEAEVVSVMPLASMRSELPLLSGRP